MKKKNNIFTIYYSGKKEPTPCIERDQNWYLHETNIFIYNVEAFAQRCRDVWLNPQGCHSIIEDTVSCNQTEEGVLKKEKEKTKRNQMTASCGLHLSVSAAYYFKGALLFRWHPI